MTVSIFARSYAISVTNLQDENESSGFPTDAEGLKSRFRELGEVNVREAFDAFESEELERLGLFSTVCHSLNDRDLFAEGVRFSPFGPDSSGEGRLKHAGEDALRSMMMDFRLMWLKREPTNSETIRDLLGRRVREDGAEAELAACLINQLGDDFEQALKSPAMGPATSPNADETSETTNRTAGQVIADWMSAGAFHGDRAAPAKRVRQWSPETYEYVLIKSVNRISNVWLAQCVLVDRVLSVGPGQDA